jgi:hypothetical protein
MEAHLTLGHPVEEIHCQDLGGTLTSPWVPMLIMSLSSNWNSVPVTCQNMMDLITPSSHGQKIWTATPLEVEECMNSWPSWPP